MIPPALSLVVIFVFITTLALFLAPHYWATFTIQGE
jgi:hypothetical protein